MTEFESQVKPAEVLAIDRPAGDIELSSVAADLDPTDTSNDRPNTRLPPGFAAERRPRALRSERRLGFGSAVSAHPRAQSSSESNGKR